MPLLYWQRRPWLAWVWAALMAVGVATIIANPNIRSRWDLLPNWLVIWPVFFGPWLSGTRYVLTESTLVEVPPVGAARYISLVGSELKRTGDSYRIRYAEGRLTRAVRLTATGEFGQALERAVEFAQAAEPGTLPTNAVEAKRVVAVATSSSWKTGWLIAGLLVAPSVLAVAFKQPWFLLPIPLIPLMQVRQIPDPNLLLVRDQLWLLAPGAEAREIPLAVITDVKVGARLEGVISTSDPELKELRILSQEGTLIRRLKRLVAGEAPESFSAGPAEPAAQPAEGGARCNLCGSPMAGAVAGVHICERCSNRARLEANESGLGLTGKERKPM